jgi:hypothetical protein
MSVFDDLHSIPPQLLADAYLARAVHGEHLTLAVFEVEPGAVLPEHQHANEQFGMVLEGSVVFRVGGDEDIGTGWDLANPLRDCAHGHRRSGRRRCRRRLLASPHGLGGARGTRASADAMAASARSLIATIRSRCVAWKSGRPASAKRSKPSALISKRDGPRTEIEERSLAGPVFRRDP